MAGTLKLERANVYVVAQNEVLRDTCCAAVSSEYLRRQIPSVECHVFGTVNNFEVAFRQSPAAGPACVIVEHPARECDGVRIFEFLKKRGRPVPVIVVAKDFDDPDIIYLVDAGAYEISEHPDRQLVRVIADALTADSNNDNNDSKRGSIAQLLARYRTLTPREKTVFQCLCRGLSNKRIARELGVSVKTVEVHRGRVMTKMGACSVVEFMRLGLTLNPDLEDKKA